MKNGLEEIHRLGKQLAGRFFGNDQCLVVRESDDLSYAWQLSTAPDGDTETEANSVQVRGGLSSNSGELVRDRCLSGHGIMLRSRRDVAAPLASGELVRLLPLYVMRGADIQWLAPFRAQTPTRVRLLREFLAARFHGCPWVRV